jgi:hypothetical protein
MLRAFLLSLALCGAARADLLTQVTARYYHPPGTFHTATIYGEDYYGGHVPFGSMSVDLTSDDAGQTFWFHVNQNNFTGLVSTGFTIRNQE